MESAYSGGGESGGGDSQLVLDNHIKLTKKSSQPDNFGIIERLVNSDQPLLIIFETAGNKKKTTLLKSLQLVKEKFA
jgi:hypothetical protein